MPIVPTEVMKLRGLSKGKTLFQRFMKRGIATSRSPKFSANGTDENQKYGQG
jgi:hypothetical protein